MEVSSKWQEVEVKLEELRGLVEEAWEKGEWEKAIQAEGAIKMVEKSKVTVADLRRLVG